VLDVEQIETLSGQVSLEMLLVMSFLLLFFVPILTYVYTITSQDTWKLDLQQANAATSMLIDTANQLIAAGDGSATTISIYLPSRLTNITTNGRELVLELAAPKLGEIDQVSLADANISLVGNWQSPSGISRILLNYSNGSVQISRS
jgi:uncharacterized protein (UPF0333 family)